MVLRIEPIRRHDHIFRCAHKKVKGDPFPHPYCAMTSITMIDPTREYSMTQNEKDIYSLSRSNGKNKLPSAEKELEWARTQTKECNKCDEALPLSYFGGNTSSADHFDKHGYRLRRGDCIRCNKAAGKGKAEALKLAKSLGLPYKAPVGTKCELCEKTKDIVFDHDHVSNTFRGWLCDPCNRSIGVLGDDIAGMLKVINYMNKQDKKTFTMVDGVLTMSV